MSAGMGMVFVALGVLLLIGAVVALFKFRTDPQTQEIETVSPREETIYEKETTYPLRPSAPAHKQAAYVGGILMIVIGIFLIFSGSPLGVIFGVLLPAGGVALLIAGSRADQREAANVKSRAEAKASEVQHELQVTELESARDNKKLQKRLNEETNKTQVGQQVLAQQQIQVASKELDAKETFIEPAREMGVDVQGFIQTNIQKVINQIETDKVRQLNQAETDKQWTEIENWLKGANLVAQAQGQQRKQLTQDFIDTTLQIADTKKNRKLGEEAKQLIINRLEKNLQQIDGELDGLKTGGLIQAANETAARRLQEQVIELPGDYPEGVGPDDH